MKKILITGAGSYIGTNVEDYLNNYNEAQGEVLYLVDTLCQRGDTWKERDFSRYDVIFHVTGIAHADTTGATEETKEMYYRVNCGLAVETARKAAAEGVKQFIYMSSIMVYGESSRPGVLRRITPDTLPSPKGFYGDSKWQAEKELAKVEGIKLTILRPPFIYGKGCKGNYPMLSRLAGALPLFPTLSNERSMLYVGNLCEFVRIVIEQERAGVLFPQNREYTSTSDMLCQIAEARGRKTLKLPLLNPMIKLCSRLPGRMGRLADKAFGSLSYDMTMSEIGTDYRIYSFQESICKTEE